MITSDSSVIGLVSVVSGLHAYFLNHPSDIVVEIQAGNVLAGETILVKSSVFDGTIYIGIRDQELVVDVWQDYAVMHKIRNTCIDPENRRAVKDELIKILRNEVQFE